MCVMTMEGWQVVADVVGHLAWPLVVGLIILAFRKPIYAFLVDAEEARWGGAQVKRGNKRAGDLKEGTAPSGRDAVEDETESSNAEQPALPGMEAIGEPSPNAQMLHYYGRVVVDRLRGSKYNTDTTSARLGSEIVGSTYADLKQAVRVIGFLVQGSAGKRGPLPALEVTLNGLELPDDLSADIRDARQFAVDVNNRVVKVDGQGAADYIDSVRALVNRLVLWAMSQVS